MAGLALSVALSSAAFAQGDLSGSFTATMADATRTALDVGGTWDGTSETAQGDTISVFLSNVGDDVAYDLTATVDLPVGFQYAAGSAAGLPGISASQLGTTLTFSLPMNTDVGVGGSETLSFGVVAGTGVSGGTYGIDWNLGFGTTDGATDGSEAVNGSVLVREGASVLSITPIQQLAAVGDQVGWTIDVENTGLGGLFDVALDEDLIQPSNPAGSLAFVSLTEIAPGGFGVISGPSITFPYLGPGDAATITVLADVTGCLSIDNTVATNDRTLATATSVTASIALDLTQPLIAIITSSVAPTFTASGAFDGEVRNTGQGAATGLVLDSNIESLGYTVSGLSPDWSYNAGTGEFTYLPGGGVLDDSVTSQLDFDLSPNDVCVDASGAVIVWEPTYQNICGDPYGTPVAVSTVDAVTGQPWVGLELDANANRLEINATGQYSLTLTWSERDAIATNPLVITQVLPAGIDNVVLGATGIGSANCPGCTGGSTVTWTIPLAALPTATGSTTLTVDFTAPDDPCSGGTTFETTADLSALSQTAVSGAPCVLDVSAAIEVLLTNAPTGPLTQQFNVQSPASGRWETGVFDDGDAVREDALGEGEFITYTASYDFGTPYTGTWAGSSYKDFLAGLTSQAYVTGTAMVSVDGGGLQPLVVSAPDPGETGIKIDLAQVAAMASDVNVATHSILITYQTVATDAALGAGATGSFTEIVKLTVGAAAGDGAACNMGEFNQGAFVSIGRGQALIAPTMPSQIDVCEEFEVTLNITNGTTLNPSNILVTFLTTGDYNFLPGQTPTYTGDFASNTVTFTENLVSGIPTNPTFALGSAVELVNGGTIVFRVRRAADSGTAISSIEARVAYDDHENKPSGARDFESTGTDSPFLIREAALNLTVTPQSITVTETTAQWRVNVTNGGAGIAYEAALANSFPAGLTPNAALTDAANIGTGITASVSGQDMTWALGDLSAGAGLTLVVVCDVSGSACSIPSGQNMITATWGCGPVISQTETSNDPDFAFASGALQVLHDTTNSGANLCEDTGEIILITRSTGAGHIINVEAVENLASATSGLTLVGGSSEYSTDGTTYGPITGAPSVSAAGVVTWTSTNIPELADLAGGSSGAGVNTVYIRFRVDASEVASSNGAPIVGSASGSEPCGDLVNSPGTSFSVPLVEADMTVAVLGQNLTQGDNAGSLAFGVPGDTVRWTITLDNNGSREADNARLRLTFPGSGTTTGTLTLPGGATQSVTSGAWFICPTVAANDVDIYLLEYALGSTCVDDGTFTAELTWGCQAVGATSANVLDGPTSGTGTATLDMLPDFTGTGISQSFNSLTNGREEIVVTLSNAGPLASAIVLDIDLAGFELDSTFTATVTGSVGLGSLTFPAGGQDEPRFTLTGTLRDSESAVVTFRTVPTQGFDALSDAAVEPEGVGSGDSPRTASGTTLAMLTFDDGCGTSHTTSDSATINPDAVDVDLFVDVPDLIATAATNYTFNFRLRNQGESGSVAENVTFTPSIGAGWSAVSVEVVTPGGGGTGGICGGGCTALQLGTLPAGQDVIVRVIATANDNGASLAMSGSVTGRTFFDDGSDTGNLHALDLRRSAVVGVTLDQTISATSETFTVETGVARPVAVGEEVTYTFDGRWFGGEPLTGLELRTTLPATLGFVSAADTGSTMATNLYTGTSGTTAPVHGDTGVLRHLLANLGSGVGTFQANIVARVLNGGTASASVLTNPVGARFVAFGDVFHSDNAQDGLTGDVASSRLHAETTVTLNRAGASLVTLVRNVTAGQVTYATTTMGDADDVLEYQTVLTNDGDTTLFDVTVTEDPVSAKLLVLDGAGDGVDNDGDGVTDDATEGTYVAGANGTVTFDATDNVALGEIASGATVTLLHRVQVAASVVPDETLASAAAVTGASLDSVVGSQTGTTGALGDLDGAEELTDTDSASFVADMIALTKTLIDTSEGGDSSTSVLVGEILHYRIEVVLPEGQVPSFVIEDDLDVGLALVATPAVTYAWGSPPPQPTITPGTLPAIGGVALEYDFGTVTVPAGADSQRTVTVDFYAQVQNVASNVAAQDLVSAARYIFGAATGSDSTVTVTVIEPALTVALSSSAQSPANAGATATYTVQVTNTGSVFGREADIRFTLPPNTTYSAATTTPVSGATVGEPDVAGGIVTWGRTQTTPQDLDVSNAVASSVLAFTFEVVLGDGVEPDEDLSGALAVSWTSLDGPTGTSLGGASAGATGTGLGERDGSGGLNGYSSATSSDFAVANEYANRVTASGDTVPGGGFRVGDLVTYSVEVDFQEGTVQSVVFEEILPSGLAYFDSSAVTPASGSDGFTFVQPTGGNAPTSGATGAISWNFGTVVNAGDNVSGNDTLTLTFRARVLDTGGISATPTTAAVADAARLTYVDADSNAEALASVQDLVDIKQPLLSAALALEAAQAGTVGSGDSVRYVATLTNTGDAGAYNTTLRVTLPDGLRDGTPTFVSATLGGAAATLGAPSYNAATGVAEWTLADLQELPAGALNELVVTFDVTADLDVGSGVTLGSTAEAAAWHSKPSADTIERRAYGPSSAAAGSVNIVEPTDITKVGSVTGAGIGDEFTYTITAPGTPVDATIHDLTVLDSLPANVTLVSVTTNEAMLGTTLLDTSAGAALNYRFALLEPGEQALVLVTVRMDNEVANQNSAQVDNTARLTFASEPAGTQSAETSVNAAGLDVLEPDVAIDLTFDRFIIADALQGLQAGDRVVYNVVLTNNGDAPAYDLVVDQLAAEELISPLVIAEPDNPGTPVTVGTTAGVTTYRWTIAGPIAVGAVYSFEASLELDNSVQPQQMLESGAALTWTSRNGVDANERTGADGEGGVLNDYASSEDAPVSITIGNVILTKAEIPGGDATYAPGEVITYELAFTAGQGTIQDVLLRDSLPTGLVFDSASLVVTNYTQVGGGAVAFLTEPTAGDTGTLDFTFGDIVSAGMSPLIEVTIVTHVADVPSNLDGVDLTNAAELLYEDPATPGAPITVAAQSSPLITIVEPSFAMSLDGPATGVLGDTLDLVARLDNVGGGTSWQPTLTVVLPEGLRHASPLASALPVTIVGGRGIVLVAGTDYTPSYDSGTGVLLIELIGANGFIGDDEILTAELAATVDENATDGDDLVPVATVTAGFSTDTTAATSPGTRSYAAAHGTGTTGTANGGSGDDLTDDSSTTAELPVIAMIKSVDRAMAEAGTALSYQITLTNTGSAPTEATTFVDELDPNIFEGTLANVTVAPAVGTLTVDANGGANGTGLIRIDNLVLAAGSSVVIDFDCGIRRPLPDGTELLNQASLSVPLFTEPAISDSADAADNDGLNTGNDPGDGDDDDPTSTAIGAAPVFSLTKTVTDTDGAPLMPGDVLTYVITAENTGNETAVNCIISDAIPSTSTYVPDSTTVNNVGVLDVAGTSALVSGLDVQSPGAASGVLEVDLAAVVTFQVTVDTNIEMGTPVINQASLLGAGIASGGQPPVSSDDPSTTEGPDATVAVVGGGAHLRAIKSVADINGGSVAPGDVLVYTINVANRGDAEATGVVLRDVIPTDTTYSPESMRYDADGSGAWSPVTDADDGDLADAFATVGSGVALSRGVLAGGEAFGFEFSVTVDGGTASGTSLVNQGSVGSDDAPDELTDADADDANGNQPTTLVVGSEPVLRLVKSVLDLNGGRVEAGDVLRYVFVMDNVGAADATAVAMSDPLPPAGTSYAAGSTRAAGILLADVGGVSPLVAGLNIGTLSPGAGLTVSADVTVLSNVTPGTMLSNQASWTSGNAGSGLSDSAGDDDVESGNDPLDPNDDDPTVVAIGGRWPVATVGGLVWRDFDHDRVYTPPVGALGGGAVPDDEALEGWSVQVLLGSTVVATASTNENGRWEVAGLEPGHGYSVRFVHPQTGTAFGNPVSTFPGTTTAAGQIDGLYLAPGSNVVDQSLPIDPSGVIYNAITRQPVPGAVATLNGPVGFDANLHLAPAQQGQTTGSDGYYQFDLLAGFPAGVYTLAVQPAVGYLPTFPSTLLEPTPGPLDPTGVPDPYLVVPNNLAPTGAEPTTYYLEFDLASGDPNVLNNHVALDPILDGSIAVTKTSPKSNVVKGDLVPWTIRAQNLLNVPLPPSEVTDLLPPGFKYVEGSALLDGVQREPIVNGRSLIWSGVDFPAAGAREIVLITVVGAGVSEGRYVNTATVREPFSQENLSNVATAEVFVVPDPIFDCSDVLGKVFDDRDGDGYQDEGERGLAGVRIVTARGLVVTTDGFGRYHIACPELSHDLRGSNFILKIDERTLPSGYRMTTENPRVVRLTRGKFVEADFGAALSRSMRVEVTAGAFIHDGGVPGAEILDPRWGESFQLAIDEVHGGGSAVLQIGYLSQGEETALAKQRLGLAIDAFRTLWVEGDGARGALSVEREVLYLAAAGPEADAVTVETALTSAEEADHALASADIRLQADGLAVDPKLNVVAVPNGVKRSGTVTFAVHANYWNWIEAAEVRVFAPTASSNGEPLLVTPVLTGDDVPLGGAARLAVEGIPFDEVLYVVRVTDAQGRYDETAPKVLRIVPDEAFDSEEPLAAAEFLVGYGESHLARRGIPVKGGAVTVSGRGVPKESRVYIDGHEVPVDPMGSFVTQMITGEGSHAVSVRMDHADGSSVDALREVTFPKDDWFYVALADLTVGGGSGSNSDAVRLVTGDSQYDDSVYVNGRLAFYLKGKIKGEHLLTVSLDTLDKPLDELLSGLDERDPRTLLRYIDPDRYYPVYGDDSVTAWDAPTQGRFFVRLERDDYKVLWGNFKTQLLDTELAQVDRGLYGFYGTWHDRGETSFGEAKTQVDGFAASPDSAAAREESRGTGGSLYYLRHRDLVIGSERVRVEVRDKDSGIVLSVQTLSPQQDYDIDYLSGRVLLTQPLSSTAGDGFAVQNSSFAGNPVYLVTRYEFVPQGADFDALAVGGRVSHWVNDRVRVGATLDHQDQTGGDRELFGVDVTWRKSATTYVKAEFAGTDGPGSGEQTSLDGGFSFGSTGGTLAEGSRGTAVRVEGAVDLGENEILGLDGQLNIVAQQREGGFSGTGQSTQGDSTQVNFSLTEPLANDATLRLEVDVRDESLRTSATAVDAQYERRFNDGEWAVSLGLRHDEVEAGAFSGGGARDGRREDLAVRIAYAGFERGTVYALGQATLDRTGQRSANNRYGLGGEYVATKRVTLDGEISGGNGGLGVRAGTKWGVTDRTDLYLGYGLDADRSDTGLGAQSGRRNGTLTVGAKHRYTDTLSLFTEERYQHGDGPAGLTHVYGADYSPNDRWTGGILVENGQLEEAGELQLERTGVSLNVGYVRDKTRVASAIEWRADDAASGERRTWLSRNTAAYQVDPDWRLLGQLDVARSDGNGSAFQDADFTEFALGWAHRPVAHERWNALFRYSYHEDLPSPAQVNAFGGLVDFAQRSHVLSADANYDLSQWVTVGGKVGLRHGELKATKGDGTWFDSRAMLYALRADLHVVKNWDALLETRFLDVEEAQDSRLGALASIWRHLGESGKLGVGYSFADFSDDLTDLSYDHQGWFLNLIGKF